MSTIAKWSSPHIPMLWVKLHIVAEKMVYQGEGACVLVCGCVLEGPRVVYVCRLEVKSDAVPRSHPPWDF